MSPNQQYIVFFPPPAHELCPVGFPLSLTSCATQNSNNCELQFFEKLTMSGPEFDTQEETVGCDGFIEAYL